MITIVVVLALGAFIYLGLRSLQTERFLASMAHLQNQVTEAGLGSRETAAAATWAMAKDKLALGWGSGSYRFCFPIYQQQHPAIFSEHGRRTYWDHAHNDYVELLAEFGVVGGTLLLLMAGYLALKYLRLAAWQNPVALFGMIGCALVAVHSFVDFQAYNPAILTTFCVLAAGVIRWAEIEEVNPAG